MTLGWLARAVKSIQPTTGTTKQEGRKIEVENYALARSCLGLFSDLSEYFRSHLVISHWDSAVADFAPWDHRFLYLSIAIVVAQDCLPIFRRLTRNCDSLSELRNFQTFRNRARAVPRKDTRTKCPSFDLPVGYFCKFEMHPTAWYTGFK